jgi:two-component system, sensor histidine kinase and response regulator
MTAHQGASMTSFESAGDAVMGPLVDQQPARARPASFAPGRMRQQDLDRPLVLVVDDNPVNLMVASALLSPMGIKPLLAADGAQAVALACELRLDLILMDLQMPVLDGFAATARIRRFERENSRARVPVVAYTSHLVSGDLSRLRESGIFAVLDKPGDARTIHQCVMRWCFPKSNGAASGRTGPRHLHPGPAHSSNTEASTRSTP